MKVTPGRWMWFAPLIAAIAFASFSSGAPAASPPPDRFETPASAARFLTQSTFGPTATDIDALTGASASAWFVAEMNKPASLNRKSVSAQIRRSDARKADGKLKHTAKQTPAYAFWKNAILGEDQLRQRMAYALSQILVISHADGGALFEHPTAVAYYQDLLATHAFGNYRDLLEDVTYSPAMGIYLTYLRSAKGDPATGRMPDENYAREIMQLFTIGLVELEPDGSVRTDANGDPIETYTNADVTGLARVFTGLNLRTGAFEGSISELNPKVFARPMAIVGRHHSKLEKSFLNVTIPAGVGARRSIDRALDALIDHDNTPPFVSRQLIQRFVTSHPKPEYVERVAASFISGRYRLPSGKRVGTGRRGDLAATLAAILFDVEARSETARQAPDFGKLREPVLRFTNWARAFDAGTVTPEALDMLWDTSEAEALGQHPFKSPSVFNFYRPGYRAPNSETGAAGLTAPELQLINANTVPGYANFMTFFAFGFAKGLAKPESAASFLPDYSDELKLVENVPALVDHLDLLLAFGSTSPATRETMISFLEDIRLSIPEDPSYNGRNLRAMLAVLMMLTSPDFLVQR